MKYNILAISDIHWGVTTPDIQERSLEFIFAFLNKFGDNIDLLVIAGDYWECKLSLNSREAIKGINWFYKLYDICVEHTIMIRMFQGTMDHDNDQLEVFKPMTGNIQDIEKSNEFQKIFINKGKEPKPFFDIFMNTTVEETLPDLLCCYCPDETIRTDEYEIKYTNEMLVTKDIGFFHGSFDIVYGDLLESKPELMEKNNVIYRYNMWSPQIKGPMISGHWHDGKQYDELYYVGSPFRWKFNEDEDKGISFIQYDTGDSKYFIKRIINPLAANYITYEIYSNMINNKDDYKDIILDINKILDNIKNTSLTSDLDKIRILFYVVDEKSENDVFLSSLRQSILDYKNCKLTIKNRLKEKKRKQKEKEVKQEIEKVDYIFDDSEPANKIQSYILTETKNEVNIPIEYIKDNIKKYMRW